ncbi:MAG: hypothetical protein IV100_03580 [Myxococcales bacterium]|nr:hypothetical protein [Myxococcales bacterium]
MRASTTLKTLLETLSVLALSACGGREDAEPVGIDTSSLDASSDGAAVPDGAGGLETADGAEIAEIDDSASVIDALLDAAVEVGAGDTTVNGVPDTGGSSDVPDTVVPLTPLEECVIAEDCAAVPLGPVCDTADPARPVYPNDCYFFCQKKVDCVADITNGDTTPCDKAYQGDPGSFLDDLAPTASASCDLPCPPEYECNIADSEKQPVCLDGEVTYANPYELCCDTGKTVLDPGVTPGPCQVIGPCPEENPMCLPGCDPAATCAEDLDPICADYDGVTLQLVNSCWLMICPGGALECAAPCEDASTCPQCASQPTCAPVCGDDGKTYRNECYLNCLGEPGTDVAYTGKCCICEPPSAATLVCAQNGQTYGNQCILACHGQLPAYNGPCVPG